MVGLTHSSVQMARKGAWFVFIDGEAVRAFYTEEEAYDFCTERMFRSFYVDEADYDVEYYRFDDEECPEGF